MVASKENALAFFSFFLPFGFMVWTWISVIVLIVGAELNAELEHQTAKDTTTGAPVPIGARGAVMADTLGRSLARPILPRAQVRQLRRTP